MTLASLVSDEGDASVARLSISQCLVSLVYDEGDASVAEMLALLVRASSNAFFFLSSYFFISSTPSISGIHSSESAPLKLLSAPWPKTIQAH